MKIGNIILNEKPVFLAPMEDITDPSFRLLCKEFGADLMYTEFISSDGLIRNGAKSIRKLEISDEERPIGIQLYGHNTDSMVEAARIAEEAGPDLIDLNFGCPVKKIAGRGAGAGMLRDVPLMVEMTRSIVKAIQLPVTVKTRLGWDENTKNIVEVAERLQDTGISAIAIHGRTKVQMYRGNADWSLIGEVKNNQKITIPVIGNGDIDGPEKALFAFNRYGVDGIMVGRACVGKPWLFKTIRHYLATGEIIPEPGIRAKVEIAKKHFGRSTDYKEGLRGIHEIRRHFSNYFKGLPDFKETRLKLLTSTDPDEILGLLDYIDVRWGNYSPEKQSRGIYGI